MKKALELLRIIVIIFGVWVSLTTLIQGLLHPKLTQTELFLLIPKSAMLNFK